VGYLTQNLLFVQIDIILGRYSLFVDSVYPVLNIYGMEGFFSIVMTSAKISTNPGFGGQ